VSSPLPLLVGYLAPTAPTNGDFFALEQYVNSDIAAFAVFIPRVSAMLHSMHPMMTVSSRLFKSRAVELQFQTVEREIG